MRTPSILQMEASECGAAALSIVLAWYGRWAPLEEVRIACGVSRDGSKASNIVKAGRAYGLVSKGFTKDVAALREMKLPFIVFWNFNHFVVVEGFGKGKAYLNDPASGRRAVTAAEFDESYTGVALTFEKSPSFKAGGSKSAAFKGLLKQLSGARAGMLYVTLATLALVIPGLLVPAFNRIYVDEFLIGGMLLWLKPLLAIMCVTALAAAGLLALQQRAILRLQQKLSLRGASQTFRHILRLPIPFFMQRHAGDIVSRMSIASRVASMLSGDISSTAASLILVACFLPLLFSYDAVLTAFGLGFALLNLLALKLISRTLAEASVKTAIDKNKLSGVSMGGLMAIESIKAGGAEFDFFSKWSGQYTKVFNSSTALAKSGLLLDAIAPVLAALNGVALLSVGASRVMNGVLSMGMLIGFQTLMGSFLGPVQHLMGLGPRVQGAKADLNQLNDILGNRTDESLSQAHTLTAPSDRRPEGWLELRGITFGYNRLDPPLIHNFSLRLRPGDRVALVGSSGSGKSTVAKIVAGLYAPWQGEVLIDGLPVSSWPRRALANSLAHVDQDILLFEGSVRQNLALWDATIPETDLIQAARDAAIHDDIVQRRDGYDQRIEESGRNLSGGQRQRMEIARALVGNPSILILDEATSALDPITEKAVDDNLHRRGCTCLIVAHRLSTIRDCDEIIVLERGRVVQRGTHDEMIRTDGPYRRLIQAT